MTTTFPDRSPSDILNIQARPTEHEAIIRRQGQSARIIQLIKCPCNKNGRVDLHCTVCNGRGYIFKYQKKVIVIDENSPHYGCFEVFPFGTPLARGIAIQKVLHESQGGNVDYVVEIESIGDPQQIVSGTTRITRSPTRLLIAQYAAQFVRDSGIMTEPNFSFQAGAGGISLAFVQFMAEYMAEAKVVADFVRGGSTRFMLDLLKNGLTKYILDGQSFDLDGVASLRDDSRHI